VAAYPPPSVTLPGTSDLLLSLPSMNQLEAGDFDSDELFKRLAEALVDRSQRDEILQLTGDVAVLVVECLDNVSQTGSRSWYRLLITF